MHQFAYLDPGSGSLFIQVVLGVLLAGAVVVRAFFGGIVSRIKSLFSRKDSSKKNEKDKETK